MGFETTGNTDAYYTDEELESKRKYKEDLKRREEETERVTEEIYNKLEGRYVCPDDESMYVEVYTNESGVRWIDVVLSKEYETLNAYNTSMAINRASYNEPDADYSSPYIEITEITYCENIMVIMYSNDMSTIFFEEDGPIFVKQ